jgi:tetratricopeptide (TPR) repeat protein
MTFNLIFSFSSIIAKRTLWLLPLIIISQSAFAGLNQQSQPIKKPIKIKSIGIKQLAPVWTITTGSKPLSQRDAKLLPAEQSLALILRPLLDKKDYTAALTAIVDAKKEDYQPEPLLALSPALFQIQGQIQLSLHQYEQAKQSFLAAISLLPDFIRAHKNLAVIYIKEEDYQQARQHLVKTITLGEGDAQLFGYLAYINLQLSTPWSAIAGYEQALLLEPDNKQWQQGLLYSLISAKDNHAAKAMLNEMLQKTPNDQRLWLQRSRISLDDNTPLDALTSMEMVVRLGNTNADNLITTAQLHLNHGSVSRAAELMAQLLSQWQQQKPFDANKNVEHFNAIESVIAWLVYEKHWSEAKLLLAHSKQFTGKLTDLQQSQLKLHTASLPGKSQQQIIKLYEAAIALAPTNGQALIALAEHYQKQNDYNQAQLLFVRAATISGFAERAYIGHAQVFIEQKNYEQAAKILRKALKINPSRQDLVYNISLLDRMNNNQI